MTLVLNERGVALHHCDWRALAEVAREAGGVDAVIVDAPYSERTHAGHDWIDDPIRKARLAANSTHGGGGDRRPINYPAWTVGDVSAFVAEWAPLMRGWFVSITDHVLSSAWTEAMAAAGMYTFSPLPYVHVGGRVRLVGDGPSSWTCWVVVGRPRNRKMASWGTLPGAYVLNGGTERMAVVGGKPTWLMRALVRDYTRPGDLVCDPCAGAGTLGVACIAEGRRALLGDMDAAHVEIARKRLLSCPGEQKRLRLDVDAPRMEQADLLGKVGT